MVILYPHCIAFYLHDIKHVLIKKWGNSAAVRIPAPLLADAGIEINQPVEVRAERGRIIIELARRRSVGLRGLVKRIRPDNLHDAVETGPPAGREVG
jgi:antitoxin MazE